MLKANTKELEKEAEIILNHYKAGNFSTVEIKAKKLLKKHPGYISIYNVLGLALTEQKKTQEAIKCFQNVSRHEIVPQSHYIGQPNQFFFEHNHKIFVFFVFNINFYLLFINNK